VARECKQVIIAGDNKRAIFIDSENEAEILQYLKQTDKHLKKWRYISDIILRGLRVPDVYDKEDINDKCKDVTAIKFFKNGSNDRIYCKEIRSESGVYVVIMAVLLHKKKTQKNTSKQIAIIENVASYDYMPIVKLASK